ncbi:MAG: prolyl oligopeptidase family serine peptidase [Nanoarchaeota archaeon]
MEKRGIFLLILIIFITSCTTVEECAIQKKDYSCSDFNVIDVIEEDENITISNIEYYSGKLKINGIMADPRIVDDLPLIIFNHGGRAGIEEMNWIRELANNGYVVLASQYRGEGGSEGQIEVALGETTDVLNLLECGKNFNKVDKDRIGVMGFSHGGAITVQAMELSQDFKVGIEFWGATDIKKRFENIKGADDPVMPWVSAVKKPMPENELDNQLLKRSAIYCVEKINAPLLIFHGKIDNLMPYEYAIDLENQLIKYGKNYKFITYGYLGHDFELKNGTKDVETEEEAMAISIEWFDKYLK